MKYCSHCGAEVTDDGAVICIKCGCSLQDTPTNNKENKGMAMAAKILMIISCAVYPLVGLILIFGYLPLILSGELFGWLVAMLIFIIVLGCFVPLAWCIPMTIIVNNNIKSNQPISTAMKICTLLFVNQIAGILLLLIPENNRT